MTALGINIGSLVAQLIVFAILFLVLYRFAFPVLLKTLDERKATIQAGVDNAEKARRDLDTASKRIEAMMNEARQESQKVIASATTAAERLKADIEGQAQQRAHEIEQQAVARIEQHISKAKADLRAQVADLAITAAGKVVGSSLDTETNRRLVNDFVTQSRDAQC